MRRALLTLSLIFLATGCAKAASVTIQWTYPRFNATSQTSCVASPDTLKDLARIEGWSQRLGQSDSSQVLVRNATGREAQSDQLVTNQAEGTVTYWFYIFDTLNNRSCRSNTTTKTIILTPMPADVQP